MSPSGYGEGACSSSTPHTPPCSVFGRDMPCQAFSMDWHQCMSLRFCCDAREARVGTKWWQTLHLRLESGALLLGIRGIATPHGPSDAMPPFGGWGPVEAWSISKIGPTHSPPCASELRGTNQFRRSPPHTRCPKNGMGRSPFMVPLSRLWGRLDNP